MDFPSGDALIAANADFALSVLYCNAKEPEVVAGPSLYYNRLTFER
ncbi:hypothetical protein YDYSY3_09040 [Paenibacillus chitinolyticus]|nr:hypothetical protein YDYSY3_09040 [Paenibacillus chitinolyticus]